MIRPQSFTLGNHYISLPFFFHCYNSQGHLFLKMLTDKLNNFRIHKHWVEVFQGRNWREDTSDHIWPTRALQLFPGQPAAAAALSASREPMAASAALVPHLSLKLCHTHVAICLLDSISQVLKFNTSTQNSSLPAHPQLRPDPSSWHHFLPSRPRQKFIFRSQLLSYDLHTVKWTFLAHCSMNFNASFHQCNQF